jgi:hypothetical protein
MAISISSFPCAKSLCTSGDPGISFTAFRAGQCLSLHITITPFYFTFSAFPNVIITRYLTDSIDSAIISNGTSPSISWSQRINSGPTLILFSFIEDTYFSIAYASFSPFNCSRVILSDSQNFIASNFFQLPIQSSLCIFYGPHGTHTVSGWMGAAPSYPTIEVYSGIKHRLGSISSQVGNFTFKQPGSDIPTFIIITPAPGSTAPNEPAFDLEMRTDGNFSGETIASEYRVPVVFMPPSSASEERRAGDIPAIAFIGIFGSGIVILIVFVICKERNWYRNELASMELGMLSYESQISSYTSTELTKGKKSGTKKGIQI